MRSHERQTYSYNGNIVVTIFCSLSTCIRTSIVATVSTSLPIYTRRLVPAATNEASSAVLE
uniref:Uncharacterized protein n=1 Tax=Arundo donax TaxID=35708 RepID=A0A0A8ZAZ1_ARUDO